jgi:hypothetical protein
MSTGYQTSSAFVYLEYLKFSLTFEEQLCQCGIIDSQFCFLSFSTLKMLAHCSVTSKVSNEKSSDDLPKVPMYEMASFSLAAFKNSLFVFVF